MYYLKCKSCGHLNEVKSEYLIFCSNCNKKLENNYSDWIKRNSEKTFDDWKQLFCTTEITTPTNETSTQKKIKGLKYCWICRCLCHFLRNWTIGRRKNSRSV